MSALQVLQNKVLRTILGSRRNLQITSMHNITKVKTFEERIKYLAKGWYRKAIRNPEHPLTLNIPNYIPYNAATDKIETIYNKLLKL